PQTGRPPSRFRLPASGFPRFSPSPSPLPSVPTNRLLTEIDVHLLDLQVLVDAPHAKLSPDAALLVATPGRLDEGRLHVVDPDDPGAELLHRAHRAKQIARPHRRREAVIGVVRYSNGVLFRVERNHRRHWTEDLLTRDAS